MASSDFAAALRALYNGGVEFVVVGQLAAQLQGSPEGSMNVEIVAARGEANLSGLGRILESIDAVYRIEPARRLRPTSDRLRSGDSHQLITDCGPLDVLGTIGRGLTYEDVLPHAIEMEIGSGVRVRVLDLATIIAVKEQLGGEKDLAALPILRRTLQEKRHG